MNIVVCIKQVVDTNDIKWTKNNTIDRNGIDSIINPCDKVALEMALKIKDQNSDAKITVITMGPPQSLSAIKEAIGMGADEGYVLSDKKFSGADTVATSKTLSAGIRKVCPNFDLILCGQYATDGDTAQTGPSIAQKLNIEQVTYVSYIPKVSDKSLTVTRNADEFIESVEVPLPALLCVDNPDITPRPILINGYIKAQDYDVKILGLDDIELSVDDVGIKGSPTFVVKAFRATSQRANIVMDGRELQDILLLLNEEIALAL